MLSKYFVIAAAIAKSILATSVISYNANFDDLPKPPPAAAEFVGDYKGLDWSSFLLVSQPVPGTTIILPSNPNAAAYGVYDQTLAGGNTLTPLAKNAVFNLQSFYLACVITSVQTAISTPEPCQVTVTGYIGSKQVGSQTYNFKPTGTLQTTMQFETFGSWAKALTKAEFTTANSALIATVVDSVRYTIFTA